MDYFAIGYLDFLSLRVELFKESAKFKAKKV